MDQIIAYLTFNGNCREAMTFYQNCLGGELHLQTVGDAPLSEGLPHMIKKYILLAKLEIGSATLMATDMTEEEGLDRGNAFSIFLECSNEEEIRYYYEKLSEDGKCTSPLESNYWGDLFGTLTDKFGNHWLLSLNRNEVND